MHGTGLSSTSSFNTWDIRNSFGSTIQVHLVHSLIDMTISFPHMNQRLPRNEAGCNYESFNEGYCVVSGTSNSPIWVTNSERGNRSHTLLSIVQIGLLTNVAIVSHALVIYLQNSFSSFLLHYSTDLHHLTCKIQYAARSQTRFNQQTRP